jgi:hypothetical protein
MPQRRTINLGYFARVRGRSVAVTFRSEPDRGKSVRRRAIGDGTGKGSAWGYPETGSPQQK